MRTYLDFEQPIAELEGKIEELRQFGGDGEGDVDIDIGENVGKLQAKLDKLVAQTYENLTAAHKVKVARHPNRPHALTYIGDLIEDFTPLAGDRVYGEDKAMVAGLGRFRGRSMVIVGTEKGDDTESRLRHNFGSAKPEGYRKAQRMMGLADRFHLPILTLVDTAGAYPGVASEERGQAEAIARSIQACLRVKVPFISVIIGEGGSGGAIAIAAADRVLMLQHSVYSVISPEGCASILWRDPEASTAAAQALKLTAQDLLDLGLIDGIIAEPVGGAHRDAEAMVGRVGDAIETALTEIERIEGGELRAKRHDRFLKMGTTLKD